MMSAFKLYQYLNSLPLLPQHPKQLLFRSDPDRLIFLPYVPWCICQHHCKGGVRYLHDVLNTPTGVLGYLVD